MQNFSKFFHAFTESNSDVYWIRSVDFKTLLYVSPTCLSVWGVSAEELHSDSLLWMSRVHVADQKRVREEVGKFVALPGVVKSHCFTYRVIDEHASVKRIRESCYPLSGEDGELFGFAGIAKDVTEELESLSELEKATYFFRFFAERFHAVFWVFDGDGSQQIYLSPGYEKVWGRSREELYSNPDLWLETLHPDDRELGRQAIEYRLTAEAPDSEYECKYRIILPNGKIRWIKDTSLPVHSGSKTIIGFAADITEDVLHEQELEDAKRRAEMANQAKSDFLAMVSHELRTPLNAINGMAQILTTKNLSSELQEYVDTIQSAGNNLLSLVSDILDFARLEAGKLSFDVVPFDMKSLLEQIVLSMQYLAANKDIQLDVSFDSNAPYSVVGDPDRIRQVMVNLISNALKFTQNGSVKVTVRMEQRSQEKILYSVEVIDTGVGIEAEKLEFIFNKFSQVDSIYRRRQGGIGLGLAITKELLEAMGGSISVRSEVNVGSSFSFLLPLKQDFSNKLELVDSESRQPDTRFTQFGLNVFVVEDNLINQKIVKHMLKDFGCEVVIVSNGEEALGHMESLSSFDIIFMDIGLPDMSGFEIAKMIKEVEALASIPIVAMTAHVLDRDRQKALSSGMKRVVAKPITYEGLEAVLAEYAVDVGSLGKVV